MYIYWYFTNCFKNPCFGLCVQYLLCCLDCDIRWCITTGSNPGICDSLVCIPTGRKSAWSVATWPGPAASPWKPLASNMAAACDGKYKLNLIYPKDLLPLAIRLSD